MVEELPSRTHMTAQDLPSFIEPPVRPKSRPSPLVVEPPVRPMKRRMEKCEIVSPARPIKRAKSYDLVEPQYVHSKSHSIKRRRTKRAKRDKKQVLTSVFCGNDGLVSFGNNRDDGGFTDLDGHHIDSGDYNRSPEMDNGVKDGIDWSTTTGDVEVLKARVIPFYWDSLLEFPSGVVKVTERLYIIRDWHRSGYLMVATAYIIRLISLGSSIQACLQDDGQRWNRENLMRLSTYCRNKLHSQSSD